MKTRFIKVFFVCSAVLINSIVLMSCRQTKVNDSLENPVGFSRNLDSLAKYQQKFLDLRFGMFIHYNIPTYSEQDWADPQLSPSVFNPKHLDCSQWAAVAKSANMQYGCLTTKHHSGFCIWDTKTTDYNVMSSPLRRDVVKEYVDAFRKADLTVMLYYSILDTHHNIRPGWIKKEEHTQFIKSQLTELLTKYGQIDALVIDGWESWWSRISYDEISFEEIYKHVKSLQPNCLICEHNADKYPSSALLYTDIILYEQNAGQFIPRATNSLPAQAGIPINKNWFWKEHFPTSPVKSAEFIVNDNLIPLNQSHCNFILNVAPNRDGLVDDNVVAEFKKIGQLWQHPGTAEKLKKYERPVISTNLAKEKPMSSSWSFDTHISDLANDDDFTTDWIPFEKVKEAYLEIDLTKETAVNAIGFVETTYPDTVERKVGEYSISYYRAGKWNTYDKVMDNNTLTRIHHFPTIKMEKVRYTFIDNRPRLGIAEILVYNEK